MERRVVERRECGAMVFGGRAERGVKRGTVGERGEWEAK